MKRVVLMLSMIVSVIILSGALCSAGETPADIRKAANEGINVFFRNPSMTGLHNLDFNSQADLDNASAGEGFQIFTIPPDRLINTSVPRALSALAVPTNQW
jgi:hypothetical protein